MRTNYCRRAYVQIYIRYRRENFAVVLQDFPILTVAWIDDNRITTPVLNLEA